jgi:hypothetical protein
VGRSPGTPSFSSLFAVFSFIFVLLFKNLNKFEIWIKFNILKKFEI